jgi:hypothetical protein
MDEIRSASKDRCDLGGRYGEPPQGEQAECTPPVQREDCPRARACVFQQDQTPLRLEFALTDETPVEEQRIRVEDHPMSRLSAVRAAKVDRRVLCDHEHPGLKATVASVLRELDRGSDSHIVGHVPRVSRPQSKPAGRPVDYSDGGLVDAALDAVGRGHATCGNPRPR